jgi:hypothetical protein
MLGFDISERTISRWMKRAPRDPEPAQRHTSRCVKPTFSSALVAGRLSGEGKCNEQPDTLVYPHIADVYLIAHTIRLPVK